MAKAKSEKLDAYYDGKCPMCVSLIERVRESDEGERFRFHDMHQAKALPFAREAIEKEIHVAAPDGRVYRGADAVLKLAERFPRLAPVMRLARTAPARKAAPYVYRFVAANRRFLWGTGARLYGLKLAILVTLAVQLAMSAPLWIGPRTFPGIPVFAMLPALPLVVARVFFGVLFAFALAAAVAPRPRIFIGGIVAVLAIFCLFDQTRLQPWIFQFIFLLGPLAAFSWARDDDAGRDRALNIARLVIASTYIYSGLQKFNLNFIENEFPWIAQPIADLIPSAAGLLHVAGAFVPFMQFAFGVGLLTRRFRRLSLVAAVAMHVFILAMFGPFGLDWNAIIWPWTAAMAVFDLLLFGGRTQADARQIIWPGRDRVHAVILVLFGVMPAFSFLNLWDSALSAALYSGNLTQAELYLNDAGKKALPAAIAHYAIQSSPDTNVINPQRWAVEDLGVPPYSETRVFKAMAHGLCGRLRDPADLVLVVREQRLLFGNPEASYRCWDL